MTEMDPQMVLDVAKAETAKNTHGVTDTDAFVEGLRRARETGRHVATVEDRVWMGEQHQMLHPTSVSIQALHAFACGMGAEAAPDLLGDLERAAAELTVLAEARNAALRDPRSRWTEEDRRRYRSLAYPSARLHRAAAILALTAAQAALATEPPPPVGFELPDWPERTRFARRVAGPTDLAETLTEGVESAEDDESYAAGLLFWCREYRNLREEERRMADEQGTTEQAPCGV